MSMLQNIFKSVSGPLAVFQDAALCELRNRNDDMERQLLQLKRILDTQQGGLSKIIALNVELLIAKVQFIAIITKGQLVMESPFSFHFH